MSRRTWLLVVFSVLFLVATAFAGTRWIKVDGTMAAQTPQVVISDSTKNALSFRVHFPGFQINESEAEGQTWQRITFRQMSQYAYPGEPAVPVFSRWIALPDGAQPVVSVTATNTRRVTGINHFPAQAPAPDCYCEDEPSFEADGTIYSSANPFPGVLYKLEKPVVVRGLRMALLRLYPVQVLPARREALIYTDFQVSVQFTGSKGRFFSERRARSFQNVYDVAMNRMAFADEPQPELRGKSPGGAEFVIICGPLFEDAANDLADWKILQGYDTEVYTTAETGTSVAAIKAWIKNAYDTWDPAPEYILFFGDAEFISPTYDGYNASDLYYVTVDGGDEWEDIHTGRISVDTAAQAQKRVDNIIAYERSPVDNDTYYTNAWFAAYFQHQGGGFEERRFARTTEEEYRWFDEYMANSPFTPHRIYYTESYVSPKYWNQDTYNWTPSWWTYGDYEIPTDIQKPTLPWNGGEGDITTAVNNGTVFITHRDHGSETGWADPAFYANNVTALTNGDKLPTVWSINCSTGDFDDETGYGASDPCFSEAWERNPNGGAVGIIASTEVSYSGTNDRMFWGLLDSMWPDFVPEYPAAKANDPEWRQSAVLFYGKFYMNWSNDSDPYALTCIEEFHWFGDPTQEMYAGVPEEFSPNHMPVVPLGSTSFDVDVGVKGALVALVQNGVILGKTYSNAAGDAHIVFDEALMQTDTIHLTITRYAYRAYEADLLAGATEDGIVGLDAAGYSEDDTIGLLLSDSGLTGSGTQSLHINSDSEPAGEDVLLTEYASTGTFLGSIDTTDAAANGGDDLLSVSEGDTITVYYHDANNGSGPEDKTDTAYADTAPPTFAGATEARGSDQTVDISWDPAVDLTPPITYQIYRRESGGSYNFASPVGETTATTYADTGLINFVTYYYVVRATDNFGHQDANTTEVSSQPVGPIAIWSEDFDDAESGIPATWEIVDGGSTACTWADDNPGGYTNPNWTDQFIVADAASCGWAQSWDDQIITETINPFGYTDVSVSFTHYYEPGEGLFPSHAYVDVTNDDGATWHSVAHWTNETEEGPVDLDISQWADNRDEIKIRFYYKVNGGGQYWGIDNIEVRGTPNADPPLADFAANKTEGLVPLEVVFTPDTAGVINTFAWDFGDGETSTEQSPTHVYDAPGEYTVSLTVTGPYGTDTATKESYITASCAAPKVNFEADVTDGELPLTVNFTDLTEVADACAPTSVEWDFGDGETSAELDPSHTYTAPGVYTVVLTYTTDYGAGTYQKAKTSYITAECGVADVDFEADVTEGPAPLTVHFTDLSTAAAECEITGWVWGFGKWLDQLTEVDEQNPTYTFTEPGVYHVVLKVTNVAGTGVETKIAFITVTEDVDDDTVDDDTAADDDATNDGGGDDDDDSGCGC